MVFIGEVLEIQPELLVPSFEQLLCIWTVYHYSAYTQYASLEINRVSVIFSDVQSFSCLRLTHVTWEVGGSMIKLDSEPHHYAYSFIWYEGDSNLRTRIRLPYQLRYISEFDLNGWVHACSTQIWDFLNIIKHFFRSNL